MTRADVMLGCNGSPPCLSLLCAEDALLRTVLMSDRLELDPEADRSGSCSRITICSCNKCCGANRSLSIMAAPDPLLLISNNSRVKHSKIKKERKKERKMVNKREKNRYFKKILCLLESDT